MFKPLLSIALLVGISYGGPETLKKIENYLDCWNWDVQCWGESNVIRHKEMETEAMEKCMAEPIHPLIKGKSQAVATPKLLGLMKPTMQYHHHVPANFQKLYVPSVYPYNVVHSSHFGKRSVEDASEFLENAVEFKESVVSKMSNLSCVLQTMGAIDADFKINRDMFNKDIWSMQDLTATDNLADPVWRTKMTTMFNDCIDMAESLPESIFENNPMLRMMGPLGRFMKFMMCKKMCTKHLCGAAQAARMVEKFHGSEMNFDASAFGAKDKYEKAMMVAMVMTESKSPLESFMEQVFHGEK